MATILVTGVTGTVMNPLCARLLEEGHTIVALVRPLKGTSPSERLENSLSVNEEGRERLFTLAGDITQPLAGIAQEDYAHWQGKIDKVLHGAASIKFQETPDQQVFSTNVLGTKNMLVAAEKLGVSEFHYVSTAYVCGDASYFAEEDLAEKGNHRNAYEQSKAKAERLVRDFPGSFSIYRIPVVVGDSETGEIKSFSGYYGFFAPFWQLIQTLKTKSAAELLNYGIRVDGEGYFHTPLTLPCTLLGPINLVPLDWLCDMFLELLKLPADRKTFHLTHPSPRSVKDTISASTAHLGLRGITCGPPSQEEHSSKLLSRIQKGIVTNIKPFEPYTSKDEERFGNTATVQALGEHWREPPDIGPTLMGRLLEFAKQKNFGRS